MGVNWININNLEYYDIESFEHFKFESFTELMNSLAKTNNTSYVYGLDKLDKAFSKWAFDNEYEHISSGTNDGKLDKKQFQVLSSYGENAVVKIRIKPTRGRQTSIFDAKKIFGKYKPHQIAEKMGTDDINLGMCYALSDMRGRGFTGMSLSANAFKDLRIRAYGKKYFHLNFEEEFPHLDDTVHNFIFESFQGGLNVINKEIIGKELEVKGICLDINSMYPYIMREMYLPFGEPRAFEGQYIYDRRYPFYFQMVSIEKLRIKEDGIACIKVRSKLKRANLGCYENADNVVLVLNSIDLELLKDNYNVNGVTYMGGFKFQGKKKVFENFINYWEEEKIEGDIKGDPYRKMIAKSFLNHAFGKFVARNNRIPCNYKKLESGAVVKSIYTGGERFTGRSIYCPFGCYVTSYGRQMLVKMIKQNRKYFLYADTDSSHFAVEDISKLDLTGIDIHQQRFGAWKIENEFKKAKFLGKKQYIEENRDGSLKIVCAGLPEEIVKDIKSIDQFKFGNEFEYEIVQYTELGEKIILKNKYVLKDEKIV